MESNNPYLRGPLGKAVVTLAWEWYSGPQKRDVQLVLSKVITEWAPRRGTVTILLVRIRQTGCSPDSCAHEHSECW